MAIRVKVMKESEMPFYAKKILSDIFLSVRGITRLEHIPEERTSSGFGDLRMMVHFETGETLSFLIELKKELSVMTIDHMYLAAERNELSNNYCYLYSYLLGTTYMSDRLSAYCHEKKINYFDLSGNCEIHGKNLLILVTGRKNLYPENQRATKSVFERTSTVSSTILRVLFRDVSKYWKTQDLADKSKCSLGQISKVKRFLENNGWIENSNEGIRISSPKEVLHAWSDTYHTKKDRIISCYSPDQPAIVEKKLQSMRQEKNIAYYLTGFSGGVRYAPSVRYNKVQAYIHLEDMEETIKYLDCKKVDSGANVELIIPYSLPVLMDHRTIHEAEIVSPVQVYLDLIQQKNRGEELAQAICEKEILRER